MPGPCLLDWICLSFVEAGRLGVYRLLTYTQVPPTVTIEQIRDLIVQPTCPPVPEVALSLRASAAIAAVIAFIFFVLGCACGCLCFRSRSSAFGGPRFRGPIAPTKWQVGSQGLAALPPPGIVR